MQDTWQNIICNIQMLHFSFLFNAGRHLAKQGGFSQEMNTAAKKKHCFKRKNRNSGATESFEDSHGLAR